MTVITISRQFGSGGDEIAERVGELLGYHLFDKRLIAKAAVDSGFSEQEIVDYSEDNFKVRSFLDRLLSRPQPVIQARVWKEKTTGERTVEDFPLSEETVLAMIQKAVASAHTLGKIIIVGRGGQVILKDKPGVLHVRIEAPLEDRIRNMRDQMRQTRQDFTTDIQLRREVTDMIAERDTASAEYIRRFYKVEWDDPLQYHLVINSGMLTIEQASQLIVRLVFEMETQPQANLE